MNTNSFKRNDGRSKGVSRNTSSSSYGPRKKSPRVAPMDAPRIVPKISNRIAPSSAPRIAQNNTANVAIKNDTSWGHEAEWYDDYLADNDSYQKQIIMPNVLRIINPTRGKRILDLACGQGFFSEAMLEKGANVIGADISRELIEIAKNRFKNKMTGSDSFIVSPADKIISAGVGESTCDSAMCILAAQNIKEFDVAIKEVSKVLKPRGKFVIVLNHPCFRVPKSSDWHFDAEGGGPEGDPSYTIVNGKKTGRYGRVVYSYMSEEVMKIDMHPGEQDRRKKSYTSSFHRPMQVYSKWLANAGFCISRIEEWTTHKKSNPGTRELADKRAKKEIPLFMCIEAVLMD
jgi:ubiquinone/menaquinone biosynthesis C-methylase UbiE